MSVAESVLTGREMVAFFLADDPSAVGISAARRTAVARVDDGLCAGGRLRLRHPELNEGAQVPRPRESVRRPLALFLYVFVGLYFFSALAFLSRGAADELFAAGRMSVAALVAAVLLTAIFYGMKRLLCRRSGGRVDCFPVKRSGCVFEIRTPIRSDALSRYFSTRLMSLMRSCVETVPR